MARSTRRLARGMGAVAVGALTLAVSCTIFDGLSARTPDAAAPDALGVGPSGDAGADCWSVGLPVPPFHPDAADKGPDGDVQGFVVAVSRLGITPSAIGEVVGFDLDKECSCAPDKVPTCTLPAGAKPACDEGGIDNAAGHMSEFFAVFGSYFEDTPNEQIQNGRRGIVLEIRNYNGLPFDNLVDVVFLPSTGTFELVDAGTFGKRTPPKLDGEDYWSMEDGGVAKSEVASASVYEGMLVADVTTFIIEPETELAFTSGVFRARVEQLDGGRWTLRDAIIAGRLSAKSALSTLFHRNVNLGPEGSGQLCTLTSDAGRNLQARAKEVVCSSVDMAAFPSGDRSGTRCTSLSGAAKIEFVPARIGPEKPPVGNPTPCAQVPTCSE